MVVTIVPVVPLTAAALFAAITVGVVAVLVVIVRPVATRWGLPSYLELIVAYGVVALFGYCVFWLYFLSPAVGSVAVTGGWAALLVVGIVRFAKRDRAGPCVE